jgi:hypothetical protein
MNFMRAAAGVFFLLAVAGVGAVTPDEHASHHPGAAPAPAPPSNT